MTHEELLTMLRLTGTFSMCEFNVLPGSGAAYSNAIDIVWMHSTFGFIYECREYRGQTKSECRTPDEAFKFLVDNL